ncbi:MAG: tRNA (adenosine(37)-N6)-dimethylallyltransferase MiaA [Bacteroidales bacterium]|nr:tRNA (adenosine(37)-N6)-dimethylallyltransferase MiaA [Bacteroidales bacterium]
MGKELTIVLGPTGVGKTDYSIELALQYNCPIINCDSRQIYREMKIGTAPPSEQQLRQVQHYFVHSHSVEQYYTAGLYEIEAMALLEKLFVEYDKLVMVGGSGMYIDALCNGLDDFPKADLQLRGSLMERLQNEGLENLRQQLRVVDRESYDSIDIANPQRVVRALEVTLQTGRKFSDWKSAPKKERPFKINKIGINRDREELYGRINRRVDIMMEQGLLDEVKSLVAFKELPALRTVGYRELFDYLDNKVPLQEAVELIKRNSRRYAKKQLTYWGRDNSINWLNF